MEDGTWRGSSGPELRLHFSIFPLDKPNCRSWPAGSRRAVGNWCWLSGGESSLEMPPSDPLSCPPRMEPASWILVWLAALLESLPSFHPSLSPGAGLFIPIPSYPERLSWIWPYTANVWERTSWPLEGKLFSNPCHKWATSLPCAARRGVFLAESLGWAWHTWATQLRHCMNKETGAWRDWWWWLSGVE